MSICWLRDVSQGRPHLHSVAWDAVYRAVPGNHRQLLALPPASGPPCAIAPDQRCGSSTLSSHEERQESTEDQRHRQSPSLRPPGTFGRPDQPCVFGLAQRIFPTLFCHPLSREWVYHRSSSLVIEDRLQLSIAVLCLEDVTGESLCWLTSFQSGFVEAVGVVASEAATSFLLASRLAAVSLNYGITEPLMFVYPVVHPKRYTVLTPWTPRH